MHKNTPLKIGERKLFFIPFYQSVNNTNYQNQTKQSIVDYFFQKLKSYVLVNHFLPLNIPHFCIVGIVQKIAAKIV